MSALSFKKVNVDDIKLSSPDKLDDHYICNLKYNDNLLYVQTPSLSIEEVTNEYILLKITEEFSKFIDDIDNSCIKYTYENANRWFKKDIPHDALMNMYENIDIDDGTIRIDFPFIKDKLQCKIFNSDRECVDLDSSLSYIFTSASQPVCGENPNATDEPTNPLPIIPILYSFIYQVPPCNSSSTLQFLL